MTWLRYIRQHSRDRVHFWPFDGWSPPPNRSVVAEVYPALWSRTFPSAGRTPDQQDTSRYCSTCYLSAFHKKNAGCLLISFL